MEWTLGGVRLSPACQWLWPGDPLRYSSFQQRGGGKGGHGGGGGSGGGCGGWIGAVLGDRRLLEGLEGLVPGRVDGKHHTGSTVRVVGTVPPGGVGGVDHVVPGRLHGQPVVPVGLEAGVGAGDGVPDAGLVECALGDCIVLAVESEVYGVADGDLDPGRRVDQPCLAAHNDEVRGACRGWCGCWRIGQGRCGRGYSGAAADGVWATWQALQTVTVEVMWTTFGRPARSWLAVAVVVTTLLTVSVVVAVSISIVVTVSVNGRPMACVRTRCESWTSAGTVSRSLVSSLVSVSVTCCTAVWAMDGRVRVTVAGVAPASTSVTWTDSFSTTCTAPCTVTTISGGTESSIET